MKIIDLFNKNGTLGAHGSNIQLSMTVPIVIIADISAQQIILSIAIKVTLLLKVFETGNMLLKIKEVLNSMKLVQYI